jgi:hypothetical protein
MNVFLLLACIAMQCLSTRASSLDGSFPLTSRKLSHQHSRPYDAGFTDLPKSMQCPGYTPPPTFKKTCAPFSFNLTCTSTSASASALAPTSVRASKPTSRSEEEKTNKGRQEDCPSQLRQILHRIETDESTWNCLTMRAASSSAIHSNPLTQRDTDDAADPQEEGSKQEAQEVSAAKGSSALTKSTVLLPSVDIHCNVENWLPVWLNNTAWNATGAMPSATGGLVGGEWAFGTQLGTCLE